MRPGLPPLNALRAFEAAARHLSFTRAAAELYVTQAAVSHQIKALEEYLGLKLFRRRNRALTLTEDGQAYLPAVRRAFDTLRQATDRLLHTDASGALTVSVLPSFAARWLVPRLGRFLRIHPEIDVRLAPGIELVDFARGDADAAIRYGSGHYPGLRADRLLTEDIFPVCSPDLLQRGHALEKPGDLCHHTLLHADDDADWRTWLLAAGVDNVDPTRGPIYTDSGMVIQAAIAGQGVAVARSVLAADDLAAGRLVRPFELSLPSEYAYYFVCPEAEADRHKVAVFRDWLVAEAAGQVEAISAEHAIGQNTLPRTARS